MFEISISGFHVPPLSYAFKGPKDWHSSVWFLVGHGGMDHGDHYRGLHRDDYRDPFPHSLSPKL